MEKELNTKSQQEEKNVKRKEQGIEKIIIKTTVKNILSVKYVHCGQRIKKTICSTNPSNIKTVIIVG